METLWADAEEPSVITPAKIKFSEELINVLASFPIEFKKVGWIVRESHKWGFLLDLNSITEAYDGRLP